MADKNERIVVISLDDSYHSEYAFNWYNEQLKRENDYVIVTACFDRHAYGMQAFGTADAKSIGDQLQRELDAHNEHVEKFNQWLQKAGIKGEVLSLNGKAGENAIKVAKNKNATMIVCGARGKGTVRRTLMGSNSEYIMNHSDIPVIVCRHKHHENPLNTANV